MKSSFVSLFLFLVFPVFAFAVTEKDLTLYLDGEKPNLSKPVEKSQNSKVIHLARNQFYLFTVELPQESKKKLQPLISYEFANKAPEFQLQLRAYVLGSHQLQKSSTQSKASGEVVDILVPNELARKPGFHIPLQNVPKKATYLFEIYVPQGQKPGSYSAEIKFKSSAQGAKEFKIPLSPVIHQATLPDQFQLKTSFGFSPSAVLKKHYGKWVREEQELYQKYFSLASEHRLDLHKIYLYFPEPKGKPEAIDPDLLSAQAKGPSFQEQMHELQSGQQSFLKYQWSTSDLPIPEIQKTKPTKVFWESAEASVQKYKLKDSFVYFVDEPKAQELPGLAQKVKEIKKWAPSLQYLVTTHYRPMLEGSFNLWCVNIFEWDRPNFPTPDFYLNRRQTQKEDFWLYTGCNAHGCNGPEEIQNPDLVIDRPTAFHLAFPWMAWRYQASGILYYNTVEAYGHDLQSPWKDPFVFTGYGEGSLFYPCPPEICGSKEQIVLPSLRLKLLRQGLEQVQLLSMAEKKSTDIRKQVEKIIPHSRKFPVEASAYQEIVNQALQALDQN